jgi:hypothetical protein
MWTSDRCCRRLLPCCCLTCICSRVRAPRFYSDSDKSGNSSMRRVVRARCGAPQNLCTCSSPGASPHQAIHKSSCNGHHDRHLTPGGRRVRACLRGHGPDAALDGGSVGVHRRAPRLADPSVGIAPWPVDRHVTSRRTIGANRPIPGLKPSAPRMPGGRPVSCGTEARRGPPATSGCRLPVWSLPGRFRRSLLLSGSAKPTVQVRSAAADPP